MPTIDPYLRELDRRIAHRARADRLKHAAHTAAWKVLTALLGAVLLGAWFADYLARTS